MNAITLLLILDVLAIAIFLCIVVFALGIVWRVEKELDLSYKFFVVAVLLLVLAEIVGFFISQSIDTVLWSKGLRTLGAGCLLVSVLFMRDLIRKLDGEKGTVSEEK